MSISNELILSIFGAGLGAIATVTGAYLGRRKNWVEKLDLMSGSAVDIATMAATHAKAALEQVEKLSAELAEVKQTNEQLLVENRRVQAENNRIIDDIRIMITAWQKHLPDVRPPIDPKNYIV